jgi:serine phosphatase RsbU (regulator of sigma subunit)
MSGFDINAFEQAELQSEFTRIKVLLCVLASLLALVLIRGFVSLAQGERGETWPFAVALALMIAYEIIWVRFVRNAITGRHGIGSADWKRVIFTESLLPTLAVILQAHTPSIGPQKAITSPAVLAYFLFILLSTLHLDPRLSRWCGCFSACGYTLAASYCFWRFPPNENSDKLWAIATSFSCAALLLIGGFAAGAVAGQIRLHVVTTLREAEARAKIDHDLAIARSIQQGLLPTSAPFAEGFDIAGWNQPADETGGDYFDWEKLPDGQIALTIADVTGHGIGPSLFMSTCRAYARAGFSSAHDLRQFLTRLNRALHQDLPPERFVTMAAGLLDPGEATLDLISAGHGPLLFYVAAEDRFRSYDAQGPPLGLLRDVRYGSPQKLKFSPGDILVLVTDGFIEWANAHDEEFGQHRLKALIRGKRDANCEKIISELYSAVSRFAGPAPQVDDLTVVIVKRLAG